MKRQRDLTGYNSLVGYMQKHSEDLWNAFGTPPLYKDYDYNRLMSFIRMGIEEGEIQISGEKLLEVYGRIERNKNNVKQTLEYIKNMYLKGAGLSFKDNK